MEACSKKFQALIKQCQEANINPANLASVKKHIFKDEVLLLKLVFLFGALTACGFVFSISEYVIQGECIVDLPPELSKIFRPPISCDFCFNVTEVARESNIKPEDFENKYAYTGRPVIVTDATKNWTALETFDFWYFKDVYLNAKRRRKSLSCQFFPYKSGFKNFFEALNTPPQGNELAAETKPWYFGWSNCNGETAEIIREHYSRPYFLPTNSENNVVDWIFMGLPGLGAHMHIDNVRLPSWQAQLRGSKQWILAPPPECYFQCKFLTVTVERGEIIILDTNKWYHQTTVVPGQVSVTIGAEYD